MNLSDPQRKLILIVTCWVIVLLAFKLEILTFAFWNGYLHLLILGIGTVYWLILLAHKPIEDFLVNIRQIKQNQDDEN